eukprot:Gb_02243 [translate_table: standard]
MTSSFDKVWKLGSDFLGFDKLAAHVDICKHIEGEMNKPGCVRYCSSGKGIPRPDNEMSWVKEKLLTMDPVNYCFTYSVIDGNVGFDGYVGSFRLHRIADGNYCAVEWGFEVNPSNNLAEEQFVSLISSILEQAIEGLDEAAAASTTS